MKVLISLVLLALCLTSLFGEFDKNQAIDLVMGTIIKEGKDSVNVFIKDSLMTDDSLTVYHGSSLQNPYQASWAFFIDDMPSAMWGHPCRYIFVDAEYGDYVIKDNKFYPSDVYTDFVCISSIEPPTVQNDPPPPGDPGEPHPVEYVANPHLWAVVICGSDNRSTGIPQDWLIMKHFGILPRSFTQL